MPMKSFRIACAWAVALSACLASAQSISGESKLLAQCEGAYHYVGQLMQLQNNEGGARAYIRRSSMMTVANFMVNEDKGVIAGSKIREFSSVRDPLKRNFDAGVIDPIAFIAGCDRNAMQVAINIRNSGKMLWGKTFDELQLEFFNKSRAALGL